MSIPIVRLEVDYLEKSRPDKEKRLEEIEKIVQNIREAETAGGVFTGFYCLAIECAQELGRMRNAKGLPSGLGCLSFDYLEIRSK